MHKVSATHRVRRSQTSALSAIIHATLAHEDWHTFCSLKGVTARGLSIGQDKLYHTRGTVENITDAEREDTVWH